MRANVLAVALIAAIVSVSQAQTRSAVGSLGVQHLKSDGTGLSMLLGVALSRARVMASLPIEITVLPNSTGRYRSETFSNGQTRCRDTTNGQFADSAFCGPRAVVGMSINGLGYMSTDSTHAFGLGLGYRAGPSAGPFALASFVFGPIAGNSWNLSARGGAKMFDLSIGGALLWR
jgi:hypothetical protein